jgi:hypothetical protein
MYFSITQISNAAKTPSRVFDAIFSPRWRSHDQVPSRVPSRTSWFVAGTFLLIGMPPRRASVKVYPNQGALR